MNLFLHVIGRRSDGYHLLDSVAVFAAAGDMLEAELGDRLALAIDGPFADGLRAEPANLVLRAARALARAADIGLGARLRLTKNLPVASGIGGGSADAAAALRLLVRLWRVDLAEIDLPAVALSLGADVPVSLASRSARMGGVGEALTAAPSVPECGMVLLNPGVPVATAEVFQALVGQFSMRAALPAFWLTVESMAADLARLRNDLEQPAIALCPPIGEALAALSAESGCLIARMSGSGATCFGLFATPAVAAETASRLARPGWWAWGGGPFGPSLAS